MKDDVEELKGIHQEMMQIGKGLVSINQEIKTTLFNIFLSNTTISEEISRLRAVVVTATASISSIDNSVEDIKSTVTNDKHNKDEEEF